jgi:hypothetical protein
VFFHVSQFARVDGMRPVISIGDEVRFELRYSDKGNGYAGDRLRDAESRRDGQAAA